MHVFPNVVSFVLPLISVSIIKSDVYQIGLITMDYIEFYLVVFICRLVICRSFYRQRDLVDKIDVVIKIHVGNVCEGIPCVR